MRLTVDVIPGDGPGLEITREAVRVLEQAAQLFGHQLTVRECLAGTAAIKQRGCPLPPESLAQCRESGAVLVGTIVLGQHDDLPVELRPESALMSLRRGMNLSTNLRPAFLHPALFHLSPLKDSLLHKGLDILVVRDLSGGVIMSRRYTATGKLGREAYEKEYYIEAMIRNTVHWAFQAARKRRRKVTSLDKAVVLSSSRLWREVVKEVGGQYPDVALAHMYADDAALQLVQSPHQFDVLVTSNLFGDILSDEIAGITGARGILPAASLNTSGHGLFEPNQLHSGSGNPIGLILAAALMLEYRFGLSRESGAVFAAVEKTLARGYITEDLAGAGGQLVTTQKMGKLVAGMLAEIT